ncbi:acyl-CoA dehydrogenase family protein [Streptomyces sp. NPDC048290]|uniref:acyl-CoA dehydrogenase family protein n=1 Tax=Streptomyces sp. NPDC048290 TaxID=3155811 RepID=UPI003431C764
MPGSSAPRSDTDLLDRLRALQPLIREHAGRAEQRRRVTPEVMAALGDTGIHRMNIPRHHGGHQSSLRTQAEAIAEVSTGCASTGWVASIHVGGAFIASLFPDEAQDEIFADPGVRVSGTLIPGSTAVAVDDGYVVNGKSPFATGCQDADWHLLTAQHDTGDGPPETLWLAIPRSELEVLDDWHVTGLAASGSNSVVARDVHVPAHRVLPVGPMLAGTIPSLRNSADPFYQAPLVLTFCVWAAASALGPARAALTEFERTIHRRGITYTDYTHQHEAPATHLQFAEAALKVSAAELLTVDMADSIESTAADGKPFTTVERARVRAQCGYVARLCKEAADLLGSASGGSSLHRDVPMQRIVRDLGALNLHSYLNPTAHLELYGRVLSGLEPNTPFI